jgi:uncharacterized coiled-coil protein SlyX
LRNALRAFLNDNRELSALRERLDALEGAHATLAQTVTEAIDDRLVEGDRIYAKVQSALGRIYRLKGWEDRDAAEDAAATQEGARPSTAHVLAAKFKR